MRDVLLVDDHPLVREGMARILPAAIPDLRLVQAHDTESALTQLRASKWNLVVLDLTLPGGGGMSLLRRIRREYPGVPVLIVSMHLVDQYAERAMQAGAVGYVTKGSDPEELITAVTRALAGQRHVPAELSRERPGKEPRPHEALSDREYQVLRLIGAGRTVTEISTELALSVKTVSTYRARILEKLQLRTSAELMHYAMVNNLVL